MSLTIRHELRDGRSVTVIHGSVDDIDLIEELTAMIGIVGDGQPVSIDLSGLAGLDAAGRERIERSIADTVDVVAWPEA